MAVPSFMTVPSVMAASTVTAVVRVRIRGRASGSMGYSNGNDRLWFDTTGALLAAALASSHSALPGNRYEAAACLPACSGEARP